MDGIELPFENVLEYSASSVRIAGAGVPRRGANCHAGYHVATPPMCSTGMTTVRHPAGPGAFAAGEAHQRFVHAARADARVRLQRWEAKPRGW